jgi:DNA-binding transcriptional LysR family regulator
MDNLKRYKAFVETINRGSITAAAEVLGYTQPGISRMLRSLEEEWGIRLLERGRKGITATDEALRLYTLCLSVLEMQGVLDQTVALIKGSIVGTIRIGGYLSVLTSWIPKLLQSLDDRYPGLEFQIFEGNAEEQLQRMRNNEIDIGFLSSSVPEDFHFIPLYRDPIVVVMPQGHPLSDLETVSPEDLARYPSLIRLEHAYGTLKDLLYNQSAISKSGFSVKTDNALLGFVRKGMGFGIVGEMVAKTDETITYRHFDKEYYRTVGMAVPRWKPVTPALHTFLREACSLYQSHEFATSKPNI